MLLKGQKHMVAFVVWDVIERDRCFFHVLIVMGQWYEEVWCGAVRLLMRSLVACESFCNVEVNERVVVVNIVFDEHYGFTCEELLLWLNVLNVCFVWIVPQLWIENAWFRLDKDKSLVHSWVQACPRSENRFFWHRLGHVPSPIEDVWLRKMDQCVSLCVIENIAEL